jgi:hypothetical protein
MRFTGIMAAAVGAAAAAGASQPTAIVAATAGNPLSQIPGQVGAEFSSFSQSALRMSRDGSRWAMRMNATTLPADNDLFMLVGGRNGILTTLSETSMVPSLGAKLNVPDEPLGVNDFGDLAFAGRLNNASPGWETIARYNADTGDYTFIARDGFAIPGIPDEQYNVATGWVSLMNDRRVFFREPNSRGALPEGLDQFVLGSTSLSDPVTILAQGSTFAPTHQLGGTTAQISSIQSCSVAADGVRYILEGTLFVPDTQDRVVVVNGAVVLQEGGTIAGVSGLIGAATATEEEIFSGGDWAAHGTTTDGTAYLVVNGELIAKEFDTFPEANPGEFIWRFADVDINLHGDAAYLLDTTINSATVHRQLVFVKPVGQPPLLVTRTGVPGLGTYGDQVDIDGDGQLDIAFAQSIYDETLGLSARGELLLAVRTVDLNYFTEADVFFRQHIPALGTLCPGDADSDGDSDLDDLLRMLGGFGTPSAASLTQGDVDADGDVDLDDLLVMLGDFGCW